MDRMPLVALLKEIVERSPPTERNKKPRNYDPQHVYHTIKVSYDIVNHGTPPFTIAYTEDQKTLWYLLILIVRIVSQRDDKGNYTVMPELMLPTNNTELPRVFRLHDDWVGPIHQMCMMLQASMRHHDKDKTVPMALQILPLFFLVLSNGLHGLLNPEFTFGLHYSDRA